MCIRDRHYAQVKATPCILVFLDALWFAVTTFHFNCVPEGTVTLTSPTMRLFVPQSENPL